MCRGFGNTERCEHLRLRVRELHLYLYPSDCSLQLHQGLLFRSRRKRSCILCGLRRRSSKTGISAFEPTFTWERGGVVRRVLLEEPDLPEAVRVILILRYRVIVRALCRRRRTLQEFKDSMQPCRGQVLSFSAYSKVNKRAVQGLAFVCSFDFLYIFVLVIALLSGIEPV